jgi:hypothetical protein
MSGFGKLVDCVGKRPQIKVGNQARQTALIFVYADIMSFLPYRITSVQLFQKGRVYTGSVILPGDFGRSPFLIIVLLCEPK